MHTSYYLALLYILFCFITFFISSFYILFIFYVFPQFLLLLSTSDIGYRHLAKVFGMIRAEVLPIQDKLIEAGRLKEKGDIFHLHLDEVDKAVLELEESNKDNKSRGNNGEQQQQKMDLMEIIKPRKIIYERALRSKVCPLLVDSRCRIVSL